MVGSWLHPDDEGVKMRCLLSKIPFVVTNQQVFWVLNLLPKSSSLSSSQLSWTISWHEALIFFPLTVSCLLYCCITLISGNNTFHSSKVTFTWSVLLIFLRSCRAQELQPVNHWSYISFLFCSCIWCKHCYQQVKLAWWWRLTYTSSSSGLITSSSGSTSNPFWMGNTTQNCNRFPQRNKAKSVKGSWAPDKVVASTVSNLAGDLSSWVW